MIYKNKILLYDSSPAYSRFIKLNFTDFEVINFYNSNNYDTIDFDSYLAVFFFVNYPIELSGLIRTNSSNTIFFLGKRLADTNHISKDLNPMIVIDLQETKNEILNVINANIGRALRKIAV